MIGNKIIDQPTLLSTNYAQDHMVQLEPTIHLENDIDSIIQ